MRTSTPRYYSRPSGLDWLHHEAADGSSRQHHPIMKSPTAAIEVGAVVAFRASDSGVVPLDPAAADGSAVATGIAVGGFGAMSKAETDLHRYPVHIAVLTNRADVIGSRLVWPVGITAEQKVAAVAQLAALGIAVV